MGLACVICVYGCLCLYMFVDDKLDDALLSNSRYQVRRPRPISKLWRFSWRPMSRVAASTMINERVVDEERCCYVCIGRKLSGAINLILRQWLTGVLWDWSTWTAREAMSKISWSDEDLCRTSHTDRLLVPLGGRFCPENSYPLDLRKKLRFSLNSFTYHCTWVWVQFKFLQDRR